MPAKAEAHAVVTRQLIRMAGSRNPPQVLRGSDHRDGDRPPEGDGNHVPLDALAYADTGIETFLDDVDEALIVGQLELNVGILLQEAGQHGLQDHRGGNPCCIEAQRAGGPSLEDVQLLPRLDHLTKGRPDPREVRLAGFGQAHASRRPIQQPRSQARFQLPDGLAEGRR